MPEFRNIEIDFEIHKRIELEKRSFSESENDVLRRLLGLNGQHQGDGKRPEGRSWFGKGVTLPHGTEIRMEYNGRVHSGQIDDGEWLVEGSRFQSPSAAAGGVALTKDGHHPSLDRTQYRLPKGMAQGVRIDGPTIYLEQHIDHRSTPVLTGSMRSTSTALRTGHTSAIA